jgi:hypothetical protein
MIPVGTPGLGVRQPEGLSLGWKWPGRVQFSEISLDVNPKLEKNIVSLFLNNTTEYGKISSI